MQNAASKCNELKHYYLHTHTLSTADQTDIQTHVTLLSQHTKLQVRAGVGVQCDVVKVHFYFTTNNEHTATHRN